MYQKCGISMKETLHYILTCGCNLLGTQKLDWLASARRCNHTVVCVYCATYIQTWVIPFGKIFGSFSDGSVPSESIDYIIQY